MSQGARVGRQGGHWARRLFKKASTPTKSAPGRRTNVAKAASKSDWCRCRLPDLPSDVAGRRRHVPSVVSVVAAFTGLTSMATGAARVQFVQEFDPLRGQLCS